MRDALAAVVEGDWLLCFDPTQMVYVMTDADTHHGYNVTACQYDQHSGVMRPLLFISHGWIATQLKWKPQVKECYAQMQAATRIMPKYFPFARCRLLCDNANLQARRTSDDLRVARWTADIEAAGIEERAWIKGEWNSIADHGSRIVRPVPDGKLSAEEHFEMHIYALVAALPASALPAPPSLAGEPDTGETPVPGHLTMAPMVAKIASAQDEVEAPERAKWASKHFSTVTLGNRPIVLYRNRLVVPRGATEIQQTLLRMSHDDTAHYTGAERTLYNLKHQARVHWKNMDIDANKYIASCVRCQFAKTPHKPASVGELSPTIPPHVHHTWYVDLKDMPGTSGYLMCSIEAISRYVKLRYLPRNTAKEVCEELEECIISFGTRPVVLRSDGGQPFDSSEYNDFCKAQGITPKVGVPYHSQGQGKVETRFKGIAASIIATLGHKAPSSWWQQDRFIARLEGIINSTVCEPIAGSPSWVLNGREPRTPLSAQVDWTSASFGDATVGIPTATADDLTEIIAQHHSSILAVQGRAMVAHSLAQALTKRAFDASRSKGDYKVDDHVLVLRTAPNRLLPHFIGPYVITAVSSDKNFIRGKHFIDSKILIGPVHVSRLLHFDASRATPAEVAEFHLEEGCYIVDEVVEHRLLDDGSTEFHIRWRGNPIKSWETASNVRKVKIVQDYCIDHGITLDTVRASPSAVIAKSDASSPRPRRKSVTFADAKSSEGGSSKPASAVAQSTVAPKPKRK